MAKFWKYALIVWGSIWALLVVGMQTSAETGISNLVSWANALGLTWLATLVAPQSTQQLLLLVVTIVNGLTLLFWMYAPRILGRRRRRGDYRAKPWQIVLSWVAAIVIVSVGIISYFLPPF